MIFNAENSRVNYLSCLTVFDCVVSVESQSVQNYSFQINPDGTVTYVSSQNPANAPIQCNGNIYTLTGDLANLVIGKSNIIGDGNGHAIPRAVASPQTITGGVHLSHVENVTVKNFVIVGGETGVSLDTATNCTITNNTITKTQLPILMISTGGIFIWQGESNVISGNRLIGNLIGILLASDNNTICGNEIAYNGYGLANFNGILAGNRVFLNSFINNTAQVDLDHRSTYRWDNGSVGNFWSSYNGTDQNGDGVGEESYNVDSQNVDHCPVASWEALNAYVQATATPKPAWEPPGATVLAVLAAVVVVAVGVCAGLLFYCKRLRH